MKKTVNWGVLGCAGIAEQRVIPGLLQASNAHLHAVASRGAGDKLERFRREFHPDAAYESYEQLLDDQQVDAVYIPLPNGLHCEWVLSAAKKKKHILCEKPLGVTRAEVEKMQAAAEENGVLLMEAFAYRQSPLTYKAKELIDAGAVGKLLFMEAHYGYDLQNENDVRLASALAGGATYDVGCYNLNLIRYLVGSEPVRVLADGVVGEKSGVDEESSLTLVFANGVRAFSYCSFHIFPRSEYTVVGDKGILTVPYEFNTKGSTEIVVKTAEKTEIHKIVCPDNYMLEIEQFGRAVLDGEAPLITFDDSLANAAVIDESLRQIFKK